jgi:hypothetical protein
MFSSAIISSKLGLLLGQRSREKLFLHPLAEGFCEGVTRDGSR